MILSSGKNIRRDALRVVVVSQYLDTKVGGAERYIREICSRLEADHMMDIHYLSADNAKTSDLSLPCCRFLTSGFHPVWPRQAGYALSRFDPDVLYAHFTVPGITDIVVRAAERRGIPVCLMYHSDVTGPQWIKRALGRIYYKAVGKRTLTACHTIFLSSFAYAKASPYLREPKTRYVVAPPGVDTLMAKGKRWPDTFFLLFVGKPDVRSKGFHLLKRAWHELRREWAGLEMVVIGSTKRHRPDTAFGLHYVGEIDSRRQLADWYASASVTVLPSISSESFGIVLAEALVGGCPVVGSRIGGIPSLVEPGVNGYLASPGSVVSLVEALNAALENNSILRSNIAARHGEYLDRFNWGRITDTVARTLTTAAHGPGD